MRRKDKDLLLSWLGTCRTKLRESASDLLGRVRSLVFSRESRATSVAKIKESLKPSMSILMQRLKENIHRTGHKKEHDRNENIR